MSLYCEENSKTLKSFIFSKILRPNIGLTDPGSFTELDSFGEQSLYIFSVPNML